MKKKLFILLFLIIFAVVGFIIYSSLFTIKLTGENEITIKYYETYKELGATNFWNKKITKIENNLTNGKTGQYEIKYSINGKYKTRIVNVIDDKKPEIKLLGYSEINLVVNGKYIEQGYTAFDEYDDDLTDKVEVINEVDIKTPGKYFITYNLSDSSNNKTSVKRTVNVNTGPLSMNLKDFSLDGYFITTILDENKSKDDYLNNIIFYGDSIIAGFGLDGTFKSEQVWAAVSITPWGADTFKLNVKNESLTIFEGVTKYKPERIIITLGINNIGVEHNSFIEAYQVIINAIKRLSPKTSIIVQSILPITSYHDTNGGILNNTNINNLNYYLAEMCERNEIKFLNTAPIFKNENGQGIPSFYVDDGIHLNWSGHQKVKDYIINHQDL